MIEGLIRYLQFNRNTLLYLPVRHVEESDTLYNKKGTDKNKQTGEKTEHIPFFI